MHPYQPSALPPAWKKEKLGLAAEKPLSPEEARKVAMGNVIFIIGDFQHRTVYDLTDLAGIVNGICRPKTTYVQLLSANTK